jgi:glycerophosphoryl diester phosphodiesterase
LSPAAVPVADFIRQPRVLTLAHRGDSLIAPENTLAAFSSALRVGADLVELDYRHSADGVPVVFHDELLDRCTDACRCFGGRRIPLAEKTLAELQTLDAGAWFAPQFAGERLASLEEALTLICRESRVMIERKSGDAGALVALIERLGVADRTVVTAFDWQFLEDCRKLAPQLTLGALGEDALTAERLERAASFGAAVIGWGDRWVTPEHVALVHARGLRAWVWTVDSPERAAELIGWGVDGLISNAPGAIMAVRDRLAAL